MSAFLQPYGLEPKLCDLGVSLDVYMRRLIPIARIKVSIAAQDVLPDELKAAIILFFSLLDERERRVYAGLESLKLGYGGDRQMAEILGLDVSTVARGRRELLEHDVNVERVRKAGTGRKAVEKKRQKSSRRSKNL